MTIRKVGSKILAILLIVGILTACGKTTIIMPDGSIVQDVDQQSLVTYAQLEAEKVKQEKLSAMIASATSTEQQMLVAFLLGRNDSVNFQLLPTWDERLFPYFQATLPILTGGFNFGGRSSSGLIVTGDGNTISGFNQIKAGDDVVYDADNQRAWSYTYDRDQLVESYNTTTTNGDQ